MQYPVVINLGGFSQNKIMENAFILETHLSFMLNRMTKRRVGFILE